IGVNRGKPVFVDFFTRNSERVNSNMVIIGKSGSGKSYATKTILSHLAADDSKVFILDPENEYFGLAKNMNGKIIDVGSATQGRLNPFQIITSLSDDEEDEDEAVKTSFSTHLQFLEEFYRQILPGIDADALEYLNNITMRMYEAKGIDAETDLSELTPEDYPIFDDLYDKILNDYQLASSDYGKENLRVLLNYISKFATGGRNALLWNGPSSISTEENFIVFNFQSLLANKNNTIANAQMLLVLKYLDNEVIKNRDYNIKYGASRKIIVVIDEAHVFIDAKFPVALDFMYQLAKRIRKYNGMQIIITQNIADFVGSEELVRKSSAIINACQYSFIFPLSPNDMHDLCKLYEKAGAINESEQEEIVNNGRGHAFVITSPQSRTGIQIVASKDMEALFTV
ncbi:MAG: ATP-binding protein, partial [Lachnospiraceae bacterium]|nr:ATP-binding protein [Lachnospiraceae bacterium]